jgi:hypothetical protein
MRPKDVNGILEVRVRVRWRYFVNMVMNLFVPEKGVEFIDQLSDYRLHKTDSA